MLNRKPFKVQDRNPHNRRGVVANSLEELRDVGCRKLNLDIDNLQSLRLEDGTIVDDEEYFQFLPDHAVIIFLKENEEWNSNFEYVKLLVEKLSTDTREDVIDDIKELVEQNSEHNLFRNIMNNILNELQQNIEAENFQDDQNWFQGLNSVPAAYKNTKSDVMRYLSQQRIRGYYQKIKEKIRVPPIYKERCSELMDEFYYQLRHNSYFDVYFDRSRHDDDNCLCNREGLFDCQGSYNRDDCAFNHQINPYGSYESRILFSSWNLDHQIELSRQIIPALVSAIKTCPARERVNSDYFYDLIFTSVNLKLVHICCHEKGAHEGHNVDRSQFFVADE